MSCSSNNKSRLADLFYENETEYYGLPPFGLLDEIGEGVVNEILNMFERAPKAISSQADFLSQAQIETGCDAWTEAVEQTVSRTFELFENYSLKNVLLLPPTFSLPHRPAAPIASEEDAAMDEEIAQLFQELQLEKSKHHDLCLQRDRLDYEEKMLSKLETQIEALNGVLAAHSVESLAGTIKSLTGQIDALKSIVNDTLDASSNAFALDEGELPRSDANMMDLVDPSELPMDSSVMSRLLELEMKSCGAIGTLSDIKALL